MVVLLLIAGMSVFPAYSGKAAALTKPPLTKEDCVKCHPGPPADIATAGGKHRYVPCMGCHAGHPPTVKKPIPQCSKCHLKTRKAHYELRDCLTCHKNPHTPLIISLAGTEACKNCHAQQIAQLRDNKSKHSALNCSTCHSVHRQVPQCTQCHKPHAGELAAAECNKCHKAHMPKVVTYADDIPSKDCGTCHRQAFDLLNSGLAKHKTLACAFCHKARHRMVPKCQDCHGTPHPAAMIAKFKKCGDCHSIAHNLS